MAIINNGSKDEYIELLKNCLTHALWPETFTILKKDNRRNPGRNPIKTFLRNFAITALNKWNLQLVKGIPADETKYREGKGWPLFAETMIGLTRLDNIQYCVEKIIVDNIPGDFIETGVWRGGAVIFMRALLKVYQENERLVWVADSFSGLPKPNENVYPQDKGDQHYRWDDLKVSLDTVKQNFAKYGLLDDRVKFLKGWFKDTLPTAPIEKLALLRLDGDIYESTMDALVHLYPKLSPGGFIIIDDFINQSCVKAVHDYREKHHITAEIKKIDWTGVYWEKKQ
ncbi:MAG: TylF/MycF family methyltransferase [Acidobacteria bacterium]|jgi:hypothetical protein|nr:TylF/MycF family methyltransferase [Acidobacteriota bacterium]